MTELQQFYEERIQTKFKETPYFKNLDDETLKILKNSITFALWRFNKSMQKLKTRFNSLTKSIKLK